MTDAFTSDGSPVSRSTAYTYDSSGNVMTKTAPGGMSSAATTTFAFDGFGHLKKVTDPLLHDTTFGYSDGCLSSITDARGTALTLSCTAQGLLKSATDAGGNQTTINYDHGDVSKVTDALGNVVVIFTDSGGRAGAVTDAYGARTRYQYDPLNATTKTIDPRGMSVSLNYDANENLTDITIDATGSKTSFAYDAMNLVSTRTDPLGQSNPSSHQDVFTYDLNGNLATFTDRRAATMRFCFDALNHASFIGYKATTQPAQCNTSNYESTTAFTIDPAARLRRVVDSTSGTITRTYFDSDLLNQEVSPQGTVSYTYDDGGRRQSMTAGNQAQVTYAYFVDDLLKNVTQGTQVAAFTYDG